MQWALYELPVADPGQADIIQAIDAEVGFLPVAKLNDEDLIAIRSALAMVSHKGDRYSKAWHKLRKQQIKHWRETSEIRDLRNS